MPECIEIDLGDDKKLSIETGRVARQASGSAIVKLGDTIVLATAVSTKDKREGIDFLPLTVDYLEMAYASGRIPGNFFRREMGRPSEKETLTSRLIDRPIRPLFPKGYRFETQIITTVLSVDQENEPDVLAMVGASAALHISDIPFGGPIAGVRVGRIDHRLIVNPTSAELKESDMDIIVAGTKDAVVMVEGGGAFISEEDMLEAIMFAHEAMQPIIKGQEDLYRVLGKPKRVIEAPPADETLRARVEELSLSLLKEAATIPDKLERQDRIREIEIGLLKQLAGDYEGRTGEVVEAFEKLKKETMRRMILDEGRRIDGRDLRTVRPITCEAGVLPRTHGSALFTRGETQALGVATLGTTSDEQRIESLMGNSFKSFILHYNFPPYSVGEARMLRGPGRREIGHGALAERALSKVLPSNEEFPYTIRVVSEILESNGSSSMATVCAGSLALMDAGIPISGPVAGIAMGLIKEGDRSAILTDIIGDEDHLGDMDFKVAGTRNGIAAIQMDIKIAGIDREIVRKALEQAREGRLHILDSMAKVLPEARPLLSTFAPRIVTYQVKPEKIRDVIGPGGKTIKGITSESGVLRIDIDDVGLIKIASPDEETAQKAIEAIKSIVREAEIGEFYEGIVKRITDFGAFVEILPGLEGLVHISQLDTERVKTVRDVVKEGDRINVKVINIDQQGKVRLSRKDALLADGGKR